MTLSVGLARITNDPDAPIRTRQALGRLATPGLLVTDKGLTIDTNGRMVLRLAEGAGLSEADTGLSVKLKSDGGITSDADGLSLSPFDVLTCNTLIVNNSASVGEILTAGAVVSEGAITGVTASISGSAALGSATITGALTAATATVTGNATVGGTLGVTGALTAGSATIMGNAAVGGTLQIDVNATIGGTLGVSGSMAAASANITGNVTSATATVTGNATVGGTLGVTGALTAASSSVTGNATAATATVTGNATVGGTLGVTGAVTAPSATLTGAINAASAAITGAITSATVTTTGNVSVGGTLTASTFSPSTLAVSGNATVGGTLNVTGNLIALSNFAVPSGGTGIQRIYGYLINCFIGLGGGSPDAPQDFYFSAPGALYGDLCVLSPRYGLPGNNVESWSACIYADGLGVIRIGKSGILGSSADVVFIVTVIGFVP